MRRIASLLVVAAVSLCICCPAAAEEKCKPVKIFNGECLDGWECFSIDPEVKTEKIWSVKDGVLICQGKPMGYLHTKKEYTSFKLSLEWRWAGKPGNSGVLLRVTGKPASFLPKCLEAQLKGGSAGDIYGFFGFKCKGPADRFKQLKKHPKLGDFCAVGKIKAAEKKAGEWNKMDITLDGPTLAVAVNGEEVNKATDCDVVAGTIALQSEGGEIHFRNIVLTPIEK